MDATEALDSVASVASLPANNSKEVNPTEKPPTSDKVKATITLASSELESFLNAITEKQLSNGNYRLKHARTNEKNDENGTFEEPEKFYIRGKRSIRHVSFARRQSRRLRNDDPFEDTSYLLSKDVLRGFNDALCNTGDILEDKKEQLAATACKSVDNEVYNKPEKLKDRSVNRRGRSTSNSNRAAYQSGSPNVDERCDTEVPNTRFRGRKQLTEGNFSCQINVGAKHQVPRIPDFYLDAPSDSDFSFSTFSEPSKLVFSQELLELTTYCRLKEGKDNRCIKSDNDMKRFINRCSHYWKSAPGWQPFTPEFGYKLLHNAQYDPERAIVMLNDPYFNFAAICDPPTRKYDNKWRPKDKRGEHPSCPFPPTTISRRSYYYRQNAPRMINI